MKNDLISQKLEELISIAESEKDNNVAIVLLALAGARQNGESGLLATKVQECVKEILLPKAYSKLN